MLISIVRKLWPYYSEESNASAAWHGFICSLAYVNAVNCVRPLRFGQDFRLQRERRHQEYYLQLQNKMASNTLGLLLEQIVYEE